jgi:hypothetical protein
VVHLDFASVVIPNGMLCADNLCNTGKEILTVRDPKKQPTCCAMRLQLLRAVVVPLHHVLRIVHSR